MTKLNFKAGLQSEMNNLEIATGNKILRIFDDATLHTNIEFATPIDVNTELWLQDRFMNGITKLSPIRLVINHPKDNNKSKAPVTTTPVVPKVRIKFLVIGLNETEVMTGAGLYSDGLNEYKEMFVVGKFIEVADSLTEAQNLAAQFCDKYEHGCEIKQVYVKALKD